MNCDGLAPCYRWLEYLSFGPLLWRTRCELLGELAKCKEVLLAGDGDGRFLTELLKRNPEARVHSVDVSAEMVRLAESRVGPGRVEFEVADLRKIRLEPTRYDAVVAHFLFDCFTDAELLELVNKLRAAARADAVWVVSEFRVPETGWQRRAGKVLVWGLYVAFGWMTGLKVRRLPDYESALREAGLEKKREVLRLGGLLVSAIWR